MYKYNNVRLAFVTKCPAVSLPTCLTAQMVNKNRAIRKHRWTHSHMNWPLSTLDFPSLTQLLSHVHPYRTVAPAHLTYTPKPRYIPLNAPRWLPKSLDSAPHLHPHPIPSGVSLYSLTLNYVKCQYLSSYRKDTIPTPDPTPKGVPIP